MRGELYRKAEAIAAKELETSDAPQSIQTLVAVAIIVMAHLAEEIEAHNRLKFGSPYPET